jgi:hypothetical protein
VREWRAELWRGHGVWHEVSANCERRTMRLRRAVEGAQSLAGRPPLGALLTGDDSTRVVNSARVGRAYDIGTGGAPSEEDGLIGMNG